MDTYEFYNDCKNDEECKRKVLKEIKNGADITANDNYAVQLASMNGWTETVKLLIDYGADITVDDNYRSTMASCFGHTETVQLLIDYGADITADDNYAVRWASVQLLIVMVPIRQRL